MNNQIKITSRDVLGAIFNHRNNVNLKPLSGLAIIAMSVLCAGCEAPLILEGITAQQQQAVRRSDRIIAITATDSTLVAVGANGLILTSPKDKLNWNRHIVDPQSSFVDVSTCPDQSLIALTTERGLWHSTDQGKQWKKHRLNTAENVISLTCAPDNSFWVSASFSTILNSNDHGKTWRETTLNEDSLLTNIQFFDSMTAIVTGEFGLVAKSVDGGQSWQTSVPIANDFYPIGSYFSDPNNGWVAGLGGQILHTTDAGANWSSQATPVVSPLYNFYASNDRLFAFGDQGTVLELVGEQWQWLAQPSSPAFIRDGLQFGDQQLIVVGGRGTAKVLDLKPQALTSIYTKTQG